tara:strand:- start:172 stop:324 length:153 start_codon:yes stop_codon:yes gene_type:complete
MKVSIFYMARILLSQASTSDNHGKWWLESHSAIPDGDAVRELSGNFHELI